MTKPRITMYVDVDGVINASVPHPGWFEPGEPRGNGVANGYFINFAPGMVQALDKLVDDYDIDVAWLTTWCHDAPEHIAPLIGFKNGLREASRVVLPLSGRVSFPSIHWKIQSLIEDQRTNPSDGFLWLEDEIDLNEPRVLRKFGLEGKGLLVNPGPSFGIKPKDLVAMTEFCAEVKTSEVPVLSAVTDEELERRAE